MKFGLETCGPKIREREKERELLLGMEDDRGSDSSSSANKLLKQRKRSIYIIMNNSWFYAPSFHLSPTFSFLERERVEREIE